MVLQIALIVCSQYAQDLYHSNLLDMQKDLPLLNAPADNSGFIVHAILDGW